MTSPTSSETTKADVVDSWRYKNFAIYSTCWDIPRLMTEIAAERGGHELRRCLDCAAALTVHLGDDVQGLIPSEEQKAGLLDFYVELLTYHCP